jgi:transposase
VDRRQLTWRVIDVENLIEEDHPARAIWELVGRLDLSPYRAGIRAVEGRAGRPALDPHLLISLWIYAYSQGVGSAREIARRCEYHPAYQWLTALEPMSAHVLSDFRVQHLEALQKLFGEVLGVLSAEGLIGLQRVMVDGTKIQAQAAVDSFHREQTLRGHLVAARQQVAAMGDPAVEGPSPQIVRARQRAQRERVERIESALQQMEKIQREGDRDEPRVSSTDPEARVMKQADGGFAPSYNAQVATDAAHGIIVAAAATQAGNDFGQLMPTLARVEQNLGQCPPQVVADGGYVSADNITALAAKPVEFIGPAEDPAGKGASSYQRRGVGAAFHAEKFVYEAATNSFRCPEGKLLLYAGQRVRGCETSYKYQAQAADCRACPSKPQCCPDNRVAGRSVQRSQVRPEVAEFRRKMQTEEARAIYRQRAQVAETPHLWIKAKFGLRQFLVRGLRKVGQELLWAALACNVKQWIRLRWKPRREAALVPAPG